MDYSDHFTKVECRPLTGRKHQIRRHACLAGRPVVGDRRYGAPRACQAVRRAYGFERLALHALSLDVVLPGAKEPTRLATRGVPPTMVALFSEDTG
jgi:23S rRNA-/tRNA-specific pseudouridylate synthase